MSDFKEGGAINKQDNDHHLYSRTMLEMKVILLPMQIGSDNKTSKNLKQIIISKIEGKCIKEGYVKPKSISIISYSAGLVKTEYIEFTVIFECKTCNPVEGIILYDCVCTSVTKGGIHADIFDRDRNIPATVYILRDHFSENKSFQLIEKQTKFNMRVIGVRFELDDPCVEIVGEIWGFVDNKK
jgi:hypothetical protein